MYKCMLRVILAERGIKHGWLAERLGISKGAMSAIINDKSLPTFEVTYKILEQLNMRIDEVWMKAVK